MRISDWSSDVCSSDLVDHAVQGVHQRHAGHRAVQVELVKHAGDVDVDWDIGKRLRQQEDQQDERTRRQREARQRVAGGDRQQGAEADGEEGDADTVRSEEHTSELQSLMRISYAVFCLKKKTT